MSPNASAAEPERGLEEQVAREPGRESEAGAELGAVARCERDGDHEAEIGHDPGDPQVREHGRLEQDQQHQQEREP